MAKRNRKSEAVVVAERIEEAVVVAEQEPVVKQEPVVEGPRPKPTPRVGNVVPARYRPSFHSIHGLRTPSGTLVVATADDVVTRALAGCDSVALELIAERCGIEWRWAHLNPGMQRMNLGNRLRSAIRRGELNPESLG